MAVKITDADGAKIRLKSSTDNGEAVVHHNIDKLPGTSEADIAAIKTAVEILDNAISGSEMQVDVVTSALPSGAATAALQTTGNTALAAIQTAVQLLGNAIAGNELQVDIVTSALPSGAATAALQTTGNTALGTTADAEAEGNGSIIAVLKRLRTLLSGGLPASLGSGGGVKTDVQTVAMPPAIYAGRKTLAATGVAEALGAAQAIVVGVTVIAYADNVDEIDLGGPGVVVGGGYSLLPGAETFVTCGDLSDLYLIGTAGDGVAYHAE
jgi:hypothetical protein